MDLLDHCPSVKVTWLWGRSECSIITDDPIGRTTQIWNNYGPKSNEECENNYTLERIYLLNYFLLVILGYGFSLFRNPAEFCSLAVSLDVEKRISNIKNSQADPPLAKTVTTDSQNEQTNQVLKEPEHVVAMPDDGKGHDIFVKSKVNSGNAASLNVSASMRKVTKIRWVRLKEGSMKNDSSRRQALYEFSPGFLGDCSIAFANERELAESDFQLRSSIDFSVAQSSRNMVHVMCAVTMILQRQQMAIMKHDLDLPQWPANEKQFHAARYRRNQIQILSSVIGILLQSLRRLPGLSMATAKDMRVIRLENILTDSTANILTDFRAALNAGLGTRNPAKIRKNGWVECAFTLWLCGLWLQYISNIRENSSPISSIPSNLLRWLEFLSRAYWTPSEIKPQREQMVQPVKTDSHMTRCTDIITSEQNCDETQLLCESFLTVISAAVTKNPRSLYGNPSVTVTRLRWCLNIIRQEGVMCPNLEGKIGEENDEYVLFLENAGTT